MFVCLLINYCMQVIWSDFHFFENFPKKWFVSCKNVIKILANQKTWFMSLSESFSLPLLFYGILNPSSNKAKDLELDFLPFVMKIVRCSIIWCGRWCSIWCGTRRHECDKRILRNRNDEVKASSALQFSNGMGTTRVNLKITTGP